jgi:hypothetical protein
MFLRGMAFTSCSNEVVILMTYLTRVILKVLVSKLFILSGGQTSSFFPRSFLVFFTVLKNTECAKRFLCNGVYDKL